MSREKGQTLVEFALILPVLLLTIFIIIESGRIFQAYVTVQHAAREGARYAVTGRWNEEFGGESNPRVASIEDISRNALAGLALAGKAGYDEEGRILTGHYEIKIFCQEGSGLAEGCAGDPGEKVAVQVAYRLQIITPVLNAIAPTVEVKGYVEMINEDFGRLGGGAFAGVREPPSPIPPEIPTQGASPTPTETSTGTITPTPTTTGTPTNTPTVTSTPVCGVEIQEPVREGDTIVTVRGDPGDTIVLRDMDAGGITIGSAVVGSGPYCNTLVNINVGSSLVDGNIIAAISTRHPASDSACVGVTACWPTSTPTATATEGPTPTPTPREPYIVLSHACINEGQTANVTVYGYNWSSAASKRIIIQWDGSVRDDFASRVNWSSNINISASDTTTGTHTVRAALLQAPYDEYSTYVVVPCPPTPTPTPTATPLRPDLIITDFAISPGAVISAFVPVTFTTVIENQGLAGAATLFWVDLYVDPAPAPPTAGQSNGDVVWEAASFLGVGETATVTLNYAFSVTGTHVAYGYVDTRMDIEELDETNNASSPLDLMVMPGIPPSATLSIDPPCSSADVSATVTVNGEIWPTDEGDIDIQWDGVSKGSVSPPQLNWSRAITISASEATSGTLHIISAQTSGTLITSTYYIPCTAMGRVEGYTWIFVGGDIVPHGRVDVYCYDSSNNLIAQVTSDDEGYYDLGYIPVGTYTVIGETYIDAIMYLDTRPGVAVAQGSTIPINMLLLPQY